MHWQQQQQQQQGQQPNANGDWSGQPAWQSTNGGWAQAPPGGGYAQPAYGQPAYGQSAYGQQQEARAPDRGAGAGYAGGGGQLPGGTSAPYGQTQVPMPQPGAYGAPPVQLNAAAMQGMQGVAANLAMNYGEEMAGKLQSNVRRAGSAAQLRRHRSDGPSSCPPPPLQRRGPRARPRPIVRPSAPRADQPLAADREPALLLPAEQRLRAEQAQNPPPPLQAQGGPQPPRQPGSPADRAPGSSAEQTDS